MDVSLRSFLHQTLFHLIAVGGLHGIHALDARRDHHVAAHEPVHVVDVGVALDGGVAVRVGQPALPAPNQLHTMVLTTPLAVVIDDG